MQLIDSLVKIWIAVSIMSLLCSTGNGQTQRFLQPKDAIHSAVNKDQYITRTIGAKEGLSSSEILSLAQDEHGFVWIGSSFGLSRYDGLGFTNFLKCGNKQLGKTFAVISDTMQHVLWVMSDAGLSYYCNGQLHEVAMPEHNAAVYDICMDDYNNYWLATSAGPAYITANTINKVLQSGTLHIAPYIIPAWQTNPTRNKSIKKIVAKNNNIYFCSSSTLYSCNDNRINIIWQTDIATDKIISILPVSDNSIYFVSIHKGIYEYNAHTLSSFPSPSGTSGNLFKSGDKIYFLSSSGIYTLDTSQHILRLISTIPDKENKWLSCLMVDNEHNLWIGMHHTLLFQQKKLFHQFGDDNILENTEFFSVAKKKDGPVMLGANSGAVYSATENNIQLSYKLPKVNSEVAAILQDSRGWMWYVTGSNGIIAVKQNNIWQVSSIEGQKIEGYSFLLEDRQGNIWTGGDGILTKIIIDENNDSISCKNYYSKLLGDNWFTFLGGVQGPGNKYWFAGAQGLFTVSNDTLLPYWFAENKFRSNITGIQKNNDEVWISTKGEGVWLCFFDESGNLKVKRKFGVEQGLSSNIYIGLICDNYNNTWAIHYSGISRIHKNNNNYYINNYNARHGFPDKSYHQASLFLENKHTVWMVTSSGLAWFNPQAFEVLTDKPILTLNNIQSGEHIFYPNNSTQIFEFPYYANNLQFSYSGIHFSNPQAIKYFYRLSGADTNWINGGNEKLIHFQRLPPGNYKLEVKAVLDSDNVSQTIATSFSIKKPFWLAWWFISVCVITSIALIWYIISRRVNAVRKKEVEKNAIRKQIAELEIKALKSQMNPHFVFNSLNSIAQLVASKQNERGMEYLSKFSKLLRIILDESENNFVPLKDEIKMLNLYLQIEAMRFADTFSYNIHTDDDTQEDDINIPALLLHPLVENAIWHGLLHKQGPRRLVIHFKKINDDILQCTIKDNGIGIEAAKAMKEKRMNGVVQKSKGVQLVKDRLKILEQQYGVSTFFSIEDIRTNKQFISGTKVTIQFPVLYES